MLQQLGDSGRISSVGRAVGIAALLLGAGLVHNSDRGTQYASVRYTDRLAAAKEPTAGRKLLLLCSLFRPADVTQESR